MELKIQIQRWGNSAAIRLPASLLRKYDLQNGDHLQIEEAVDHFVLRPLKARPKYSLEQLLSQCDPDAPDPEDLKAWRDIGSTGREI